MITPTLPPPTPTTPPTSEIQKIREAIQEKVKEKLQEISQKEDIDPKRAITATVTKIEGTTLFFDTQSSLKQATINDHTVYIGLKQNHLQLSDIKAGQEVLAIGLVDQNQQFNLKRLLLTSRQNFQNPKVIVLGQVVDISTSSPVLVAIPYADKNSQYQIKYNNSTEFVTKTGKKINSDSVTKGQKIAVVATPDSLSSQSLNAEKIVTLD